MKKIKTILIKEWMEVFKNKMVIFTVAFLPLMMVTIPLAMLVQYTGISECSHRRTNSRAVARRNFPTDVPIRAYRFRVLPGVHGQPVHDVVHVDPGGHPWRDRRLFDRG